MCVNTTADVYIERVRRLRDTNILKTVVRPYINKVPSRGDSIRSPQKAIL